MKRRLFTLLLTFVTSVWTLCAMDARIGEFYYELDLTKKTATLTGPYGNSATVTIPYSVYYSGSYYYVTSIKSGAFRRCNTLKSITIPSNITSIGVEAFYDCANLESVTILGNVSSIGNKTFYRCSKIKSISIPNSVTSIGNYAFYYCSSLISIDIPNGVTNIGDEAFRGCNKLTNVEIPSSVTSIGQYAFSDCTSLNTVIWNAKRCNKCVLPFYCSAGENPVESVVFGDSVEIIPALLCRGTNITTITIPNSVTCIGDSAFQTCASLTSVDIPNSVTKIGNDAFASCSNLTSVTIGNGVTSLGDGAFYNCRYLTSITIPNSVIRIGKEAFASCSGLTSITIPNSVTSIGYRAFAYCSNMTSVVINNGLKQIERSVFDQCTGLNAVHINDLSAWCNIAFAGECANPLYYAKHLYLNGIEITDLVIPDSVTRIGSYSFINCSGLTSITIPNSVTSIGRYSLWNCSRLTSITIPNSVINIEENAFSYCSGLTSVTIPNSVTDIGVEAFSYCKNLISITIGTDVTKIGHGVFCGCDNLTSVTWNVRGCEYFMSSDTPFYYSGSSSKSNFNLRNQITSFVFGTEVEFIPGYLCSGLTKLKSITIPNRVTDIGEYAFSGCSGLTSVVIPDSVIGIEESAFSSCSGLTSVTIGNGVTSIGESAFSGCNGLTSVTIPKSVTNIGNYAFKGVQNVNYTGTATGSPWGALFINNDYQLIPLSTARQLASQLSNKETSTRSYYITGKVSEISEVSTSYGNATYYISDDSTTFYCYRLYYLFQEKFSNANQLQVGDSITLFCKLKNYNGIYEAVDGYMIYTDANPSHVIDNLYYQPINSNEAVVSYVGGPGKLTSVTILDQIDIDGKTYTVTKMGRHAFSNCSCLISVTIPVSITSIGEGAFLGCSNLTSITIPNGVTSIGQETFSGCYSIQSVNIPNSVTRIGDKAFYDCYHLVSVTIPNSVSSLGKLAFADCSGLTSVIIGNGVTNIGDSTFYGCTCLTSITIGTNVTNIGNNAFYRCNAIQSVTWNAKNCNTWNFGSQVTSFEFGDGVESIPVSLCSGMNNLTSIVIPNSVTSIGESAFEGCASLKTLSLGEKVAAYGNSMFAGCPALTSIYNYRERPAKLGTNTFTDVDYFNCTLYVLAGSVDMYKSTGSDWKDFYFIEPISAQETSTNGIILTPDDNSVNVVWPSVSGADTYEIVIKDKYDNEVCSLIFNANGQLIQIAFKAPALDNAPQQLQNAGFSFTVSGLESGTKYNVTITSKDNNGTALDTKTVSFTTTSGEQAINTPNTQCHSRKIMVDGQIFILRGDRAYTLQGQEMR